jgi:carbonic anhydrase/acetyltransferase-like protein (isoleucine patch superfamily)/uncharacterized damage-inducible protein DinB
MNVKSVHRGPGDWTARLRIHGSVFVAPGAVVVGDVTIGERSSVWFNTVVRGDTAPVEVGASTNLQDNTVVHVDEGQPAIIGSRVTVGHRAIVHGCVIEDDCLIGMGSIVLSGARIGRGSLVGAGALVREGQSIPPGSLVVGAPARAVGPVTGAHREAIERGAAHYAELAASYVRRGFARARPWPDHPTGVTALEPGAMSFLEWGQLLAVLGESIDWVAERLTRHDEAAWRRAPGPQRWSAVEVLCHLRDCDREALLPRLGRLLEEERPEFPDMDMTGYAESRRYRDTAPAQALEEWRAARRAALARLAPLGRAEWTRSGVHSVRGPYSIAELVRYFANHDLGHRRQIAVALEELA